MFAHLLPHLCFPCFWLTMSLLLDYWIRLTFFLLWSTGSCPLQFWTIECLSIYELLGSLPFTLWIACKFRNWTQSLLLLLSVQFQTMCFHLWCFCPWFHTSLFLYIQRGKAWAVQLLAVACLSIAAKVEETTVPQSLDLQVLKSCALIYNGWLANLIFWKPVLISDLLTMLLFLCVDCAQVGDPKFVFEAKTILRMELLVMSTLKWRMQACTPYSFIDYFLSKISDDQHPSTSSICRSEQLILSTIRGFFFSWLWMSYIL